MSISTNKTTVGELVTVLGQAARNLGISDTDNTIYDLSEKHRAIRQVLNLYIRLTKVTMRTDSVSMPSGASYVDLSGLNGLSVGRIIRMWAVPYDGSQGTASNPDVKVEEVEDVDGYRQKNGVQTGHPLLIGFYDQDNSASTSNLTALKSDIQYAVRVKWYPPVVDWTIGDSGTTTSNTVINVTGDLAIDAVRLAGVVFLQSNQVEITSIVDRKNAAWELLVSRGSTESSLGVRSIPRKSVYEVRAERRF